MPLQRRYSVTGQTPSPDNVPVMKSPKLQALDTSVQNTSCGLCEGGGTAIATLHRPSFTDQVSGGRPLTMRTARTSSKRSATQLPSPNTPSSHELPTKIARLGLDQDDMDVNASEDDDAEPVHDYCFAYPSDFEDDCVLSTGVTTPEDHALSSPPPTYCDDTGFSLQLCAHDHKYLLALQPESDLPTAAPGPEPILCDLEPEPLQPTTPPPPPSQSTTPITFETLPPEIRSQIYLELGDLVLSYPLIYCLSTFANRKQHPLAAVSRLIRDESLAIFYSYNTWIIKLEFRLMYESFQDWIIQLGDNACSLRLVTIAVRGRLFKPKTTHTAMGAGMGIGMGMAMIGGAMAGVPHQLVSRVEGYSPPDGDASFRIDLSEKYNGGRVTVDRNDGTMEAGEEARGKLEGLVRPLWEKRKAGTLNGQDWVNMVDAFLRVVGWW
ncbi:hypothetical protein P154DRAFT_450740 [Amniculicola lignicola CBS 123094]|uniref:F-box domain-containing protein n=1 Tax=Amniculicola lignicola CBS 123094 TaxID=1392246 RepID=A0A6A5VTV9_9PLEO|nr:hypothetical protein P154DRAFT_450740 [Amniculicola lignicola CBS 123094]